MRFICGDKFVEMSDFTYNVGGNPDDYYHHPNTFEAKAVESFSGTPIIYTMTSNVGTLFPMLEKTNKRIVLLTHNSDHRVTKELYDKLPPNVIRWFSLCVDYHGDRLTSLPVGIENRQRIEFHHQPKVEKLLAKRAEEKTYKNLLYICFSIWTNKKERELPYKLLAGKPFVTTIPNPNIFDFDRYIDDIYRHKFVLCPEGNGTDTHRKWESLYLDSIPVEKRNVNNSFYQDLPICFVDSWEQVTEEFLNVEYERIINTTWNLDKIEFPYWKNLIKSYTI